MRAKDGLARTPISVDERLREPIGGLVGVFRSGISIPAHLVFDPAAHCTLSDNAVNDVLSARRSGFFIRFGSCGRGDSVPRPAWHLHNAVDAHAIFHAVRLDEDRGVRSGAHAKRTLCPRSKLDRELVRSGRTLRARASLDACQRAGRAIDVDKITCPDNRTEADFLFKIVLIPLLRCG